MGNLWDILGQKHAIDLLVRIYDYPGRMQKEITDGPGKTVRTERLGDLLNAGLIRTDSVGANWTAIRYFVTEEGARIARGLKSIESGEEIPDDPIDYDAPSQEGNTVR